MNDFERVYIKQIEIISGSSVEHVKAEVNKFLKSLAKMEDYYPSEIKIHSHFQSSESQSSSYGIQTYTVYTYTIEYMTQMKIAKGDKIKRFEGIGSPY
jgi:hypothetical protein